MLERAHATPHSVDADGLLCGRDPLMRPHRCIRVAIALLARLNGHDTIVSQPGVLRRQSSMCRPASPARPPRGGAR